MAGKKKETVAGRLAVSLRELLLHKRAIQTIEACVDGTRQS